MITATVSPTGILWVLIHCSKLQLPAAHETVDAEHLSGAPGKTLKSAYREIEDQEDEHLYHTKGWCRELWMQSLGMKAMLPPPEERKHVKTAIGAARAEQEADRAR